MEGEYDDDSGTFLTVEKTADGYVEQDANGNSTEFVKVAGSRELLIEDPIVVRQIDPQSGVSRCVIQGEMRERVRAIGNAREFRIVKAFLEAGTLPGFATLAIGFADTPFLGLSIQVSEDASATLVRALQDAAPNSVISIEVAEGEFWGPSPDEHDILLLPWLQEREHRIAEDGLTVEFPLTVSELAVVPSSRGLAQNDGKETSIGGRVGIYYAGTDHPLKDVLRDLQGILHSIDISLASLKWALAIFAIVLLIRLW